MRNGIIRKAERDEKRMRKKRVRGGSLEQKYYDEHGVLEEIIEEPIEMGLETELRRAILFNSLSDADTPLVV